MAGQAVSSTSVMQLSALATITSIPRERSCNDFPVTVRVRAGEMRAPRCPPVDVVALVDISGSVGDRDPVSYESGEKTTRLEHEKKALKEVDKLFGCGDGGGNRLAVVAFHDYPVLLKELGKPTWHKAKNECEGGTKISPALDLAIQILDTRAEEKQRRPAFIVLLSDGFDRELRTKVRSIKTTYPIHAFGFWAETIDRVSSLPTTTLEDIPKLNLGTYTRVNEHVEKVTEKLLELCGELASVLAVDTRVSLRTVHPGVTLSRVEVEPSLGGVQIREAKESGEVSLGMLRSGDDREFTVYLNVPEGPPGDNGASSMELLTVGGSYRQSWDDQLVALDESVVAVARPASPREPSSRRCKELLDGIEKKLQLWCKVKHDLHRFNGSSRSQCLVSEALREASLEAVNIAMHQDIYMAVQQAIKLRHCGNGGTTMENAPSPAAAV